MACSACSRRPNYIGVGQKIKSKTLVNQRYESSKWINMVESCGVISPKGSQWTKLGRFQTPSRSVHAESRTEVKENFQFTREAPMREAGIGSLVFSFCGSSFNCNLFLRFVDMLLFGFHVYILCIHVWSSCIRWYRPLLSFFLLPPPRRRAAPGRFTNLRHHSSGRGAHQEAAGKL